MQLLVLFADLLYFLLFVISDLSDLTLQLIDLFLFLFGVLRPILSQLQQLSLAIGLCLFQ